MRRCRRHRSAVFGAIVVAGIVTVGCGDPGTLADTTVLRVGVASSFRHVADEMRPLLAERGIELEISSAPTPTLAAQVRDGAGLDAVIFADDRFIDDLSEQGWVKRVGPTLATDVLVAVPAGNPGAVSGPEDLADPDRDIGICDPRVPCGAYAVEWLGESGLSVDTYEPSSGSLVGRLVSRELDAAVTYRSEIVAAGGSLEEIPTPDDPGPVATTAFAHVTGSPRSDEIDRLVAALGDDRVRDLVEAGGYRVST